MNPLTNKLTTALRAHFQNGIPIQYLRLSPQQKEIFARIEAVYFMWLQDPDTDIYMTLYQMHKMLTNQVGGNTTVLAKRDEKVLLWVKENIKELHPNFKIKPAKRRKQTEVEHTVVKPKPKPKPEPKPKKVKPGPKPEPEPPKEFLQFLDSVVGEPEPIPAAITASQQPFYMSRPTDPDVFAAAVLDCIRPEWFEQLSGVRDTLFYFWQFNGTRFLTQQSAVEVLPALHIAANELRHINLYTCRHAGTMRLLDRLNQQSFDLTALAHHFFDPYMPPFNPHSRSVLRLYTLHFTDIETAIRRQLPAYINSLIRALTNKFNLQAA